MTSIKLPSGDMPDNLPLLTQVADEDAPDDLPTLTEVVAEEQAERAIALQPGDDHEAPASETITPASCAPDEQEMQRLLRLVEIHLETVFSHKLGLHLEHLQRQAVAQAVSELKTELPELLRDALKARHGL